MNSITQTQRYLPHELITKYYSVMLYRTGVGVAFDTRKYHISKSSLLRWNKKFDDTKESLMDKSHKPHSTHPNAHTLEEIKWIKDYHRRNPHISVCELYGKLRTEKGYSRHPGSLYRVFRRLGYSISAPSTKKMRKSKPYDTPTELGVKWQMYVKHIPAPCYSGPTMELSNYSTVDFLYRAINYFDYKPKILQTDNGAEFTNIKKADRVHILDIHCKELNIEHKRIRPRTPRHNGKIEHSHRNDQERFCNFLKFYNYDDLKVQMKRYLNHSNSIPMQVLEWKSPLQKQMELEGGIHD